MAAGQSLHPRHQGGGLAHRPGGQVAAQGLLIQGGRRAVGRQQGAQFRGEGQGAPGPGAEVEGLDAVGIAGQQGAAFLGIEQAEGEHAAQGTKPITAAVDQPGQQHLGVAAAPEPLPLGFEPLAQVGVVVDLAVEDQ